MLGLTLSFARSLALAAHRVLLVFLCVCYIIQAACCFTSFHAPDFYRSQLPLLQGAYLGVEWLAATTTAFLLRPQHFTCWTTEPSLGEEHRAPVPIGEIGMNAHGTAMMAGVGARAAADERHERTAAPAPPAQGAGAEQARAAAIAQLLASRSSRLDSSQGGGVGADALRDAVQAQV